MILISRYDILSTHIMDDPFTDKLSTFEIQSGRMFMYLRTNGWTWKRGFCIHMYVVKVPTLRIRSVIISQTVTDRTGIANTNTESHMQPLDWYIYIWSWPILKVRVTSCTFRLLISRKQWQMCQTWLLLLLLSLFVHERYANVSTQSMQWNKTKKEH